MIATHSSLNSFSLQLAFTAEIQHQLILCLLIRNDVELARHCLRVANLCQKFQNTLLVCGGPLKLISICFSLLYLAFVCIILRGIKFPAEVSRLASLLL